jgi:hypothetical protein
MANLDRDEVIELLERLGRQDDAEVLAAARALHERVSLSELSWDDLLIPDADLDVDDEEDDEEDEDEAVGDEELDEDEPGADAPVPADLAEDARILERLLARKGLSPQTREELSDLKRDMENGEFGAMDSRYVRALAGRLEA